MSDDCFGIPSIITFSFFLCKSVYFCITLSLSNDADFLDNFSPDLCSGGSAPGNPDGTVFDVLDRFNIQETEPEMYEILRYYTEVSAFFLLSNSLKLKDLSSFFLINLSVIFLRVVRQLIHLTS